MAAYACAIYASSGLASVAARIAAAAANPGVAVVDTFTDAVYSRSSVKLVGGSKSLLAAACAGAAEAVALVDLSAEPHPAPHPRQGYACGASPPPAAHLPLPTSR